ncbi:hypothetical protein Ancab_011184 [Ancistrocladus abbreviatus]
MDNNPMFMPLPPEFGMLIRLQELRLGNSGFSGTIPPTFSQLMNLTTLSYGKQQRLGRNLDLSGNPGLCLDPSEAYGVNIGVDVCGKPQGFPCYAIEEEI